jgi:hypothetical protein
VLIGTACPVHGTHAILDIPKRRTEKSERREIRVAVKNKNQHGPVYITHILALLCNQGCYTLQNPDFQKMLSNVAKP